MASTTSRTPTEKYGEELPEVDLFERVESVEKMEPGRVASLVENYFYTPRSVTRANRDFIPRQDDVIVATNPRSGDDLVLRVVRLINARDEEEFEEVLRDKRGAVVPWIESRFVDGNPDILQADQPGSRRIFKTHMAHQGLNIKRKNAPLFISTCRHPVDMRVSWFNYIRDCYYVGDRSKKKNFEDIFGPSDFVDVSASTSQINPTSSKTMTFEHIIMDWFLESKRNPKRVHLVVYELFLTEPQRVVKDLSEFLGAAVSDARIERIVSACVEEGFLNPHNFLSSRGGMSKRRDSITPENGLRFSWEASEKMKEKWRRAIESNSSTPDAIGENYERFFTRATGGTAYPFEPKLFPPRPPKTGPLDILWRNIQNGVKHGVDTVLGKKG